MVNQQAKALEETVNVFGMIQGCVGELVEGIRIVTEKNTRSKKKKAKYKNEENTRGENQRRIKSVALRGVREV